jgi:hypothetical protein
MIETWNNIIKDNLDAVFFKNFHDPDMDWNDVMNFTYSESIKSSDFKQTPEEQKNHPNVQIFGNLKVQPPLYMIPLARDIHNFFNSVPGLMEKISGNSDVNFCNYYVGKYNEMPCSCKSIWHIQGLRLSLSDTVINHHHDPCDVLVWQMVGNSYWTINEKDTYTLSPGDLLYVSKNATHGITQNGPRLTMIIDGLKPGYGKDEV